MPTIYDIAEKADVLPRTVSRVLNDSGYVSKEVRQRVKKIAEEINYIPHGPARNLVKKRTNMIGVIIPDMANPAYAEITLGIYKGVSNHGYHILVGNTYGKAQEEISLLQSFHENRVDGLVLISAETVETESCTRYVNRLIGAGIPVVLSGAYDSEVLADQVAIDDISGVYQAIKHLIEIGHSRIAFIGGPPCVLASKTRFNGYKKALDNYGIAVDEDLILYGRFDEKSGLQMMRQLLKNKECPKAVFAANDVMAFGAMQAIKEAGLEIPRDIALVGFDDIALAEKTTPSLTTVAMPKEEIGRAIAEILVKRIQGEGPPERQEIILETTLIIRESTVGKR